MMPLHRPLSAALCATLAILASGCVTLSRPLPQKTRYLLEPRRGSIAPEATPASDGRARGAIFVDPVHVNPLFDHKGFLYRVGENEYERDFYHELWVSPGVLVRQATIEWLRESPALRSGLEERRRSVARWRLGGRVDRLYADLRAANAPLAVIEVSFDLVDARAETSTEDSASRWRYRAQIPAHDTSPAALARAWNDALSRILTDLESDLARALAP